MKKLLPIFLSLFLPLVARSVSAAAFSSIAARSALPGADGAAPSLPPFSFPPPVVLSS